MFAKTKQHLLLIAVVSVLIQGCAGLRIYDAPRDAQATTIKEDFAKIELLEIIETQTGNLTTHLAQETRATDAKNLLLRDQFLFNVTHPDATLNETLFVFGPKDKQSRNFLGSSYIAGRAKILGATSPEALTELAKEYRRRSGDDASLTRRNFERRTLIDAGLKKPPTCVVVIRLDLTDENEARSFLEAEFAQFDTAANRDARVRRLLVQFRVFATYCQSEFPDANIAKLSSPERAVAKALKTLEEISGEIDDIEAAKAKAKAEVSKFADQYKKAVDAQGPGNSPTKKKLQELACSLIDAIGSAGAGEAKSKPEACEEKKKDGKDGGKSEPKGNAEAASDDAKNKAASGAGADANGAEAKEAGASEEKSTTFLGVNFAEAEEQVEAITTLLIALASGEPPEDLGEDIGLAKALVVAAAVPSLTEHIDALSPKSTQQSVSALLIQKSQAEVTLDYARRRLDILNLRKKYARDYLEALLHEAYLLNRVNLYQQDYRSTVGRFSGKTAFQVLRSKDNARAPARVIVFKAAGSAADSIALARAEQDRLEYAIIHTQYLEATAGDAYAIDAWNKLIAGPINQLANYYKGGIKSEEIARLFLALSELGALGVIAGTN